LQHKSVYVHVYFYTNLLIYLLTIDIDIGIVIFRQYRIDIVSKSKRSDIEASLF